MITSRKRKIDNNTSSKICSRIHPPKLCFFSSLIAAWNLARLLNQQIYIIPFISILFSLLYQLIISLLVFNLYQFIIIIILNLYKPCLHHLFLHIASILVGLNDCMKSTATLQKVSNFQLVIIFILLIFNHISILFYVHLLILS